MVESGLWGEGEEQERVMGDEEQIVSYVDHGFKHVPYDQQIPLLGKYSEERKSA